MKLDLLRGIRECSVRGLKHSVKWMSELNFALDSVKLAPDELPIHKDEHTDEMDALLIAKSYFDLREFDRSAHFTRDCVRPKARFLHLYSRYLSLEKKKLDNMTDSNCAPDSVGENAPLKDLYTVLRSDYYENKLDGFCMYLYGITLKKLDLSSVAVDVFIKAVNAEPMLWCAWYELGKLIPDKSTCLSSQLPNHWIKQFFLAHAYLEQLNNDEALQIYFNLYSQGLEKSTYLMSQIAIGHHNRRGEYLFKF